MMMIHPMFADHRFPALFPGKSTIHNCCSILTALAMLSSSCSATTGIKSDQTLEQNIDATVLAAANDETASILKALLPEAGGDERKRALEQIAKSKEKRFIGPLLDILRFTNGRAEYIAIADVLGKLTGEKAQANEDLWSDLTIWYAENTELSPPPGYTGWKGELLAQLIDPRFRRFLYDGAKTSVRVEEVVWGGVRVDGIPALVNPKMLAAADANFLSDSEPVFGVSINGDNRAYPLRILDWHEMANDVVGGRAVALAYCTLCGAGILYDTTVAGTTYEFGSSGFLMRSNKLMYDRTTDTLWNQLTGEPVIGKLVGSKIKLEVLPIVLTSWGEWKREHPDTKAVDVNTGYERPYQVGATYGRYFADPGTMFPVRLQRKALATKTRIFAIQLDGLGKAYPLDALNRAGGVVNDTLGKRPLVIQYRDAVGRVPLSPKLISELKGVSGGGKITVANDMTLDAAQAILKKNPELIREFTADILLAMPTEARLTLLNERTSDERQGTAAQPGMFSPNFRNDVAQRGLIGETRAFERGAHNFKPSKSKEELIDETGRIWRVTEDNLVAPDGKKLPRLGGHLAFWFGWFSFFPKTEIYSER